MTLCSSAFSLEPDSSVLSREINNEMSVRANLRDRKTPLGIILFDFHHFYLEGATTLRNAEH